MELSLQKNIIKDGVIKTLKTIYDPEIPVNIYDLGLIYEVEVADDLSVHIVMTLTAPNCPVAESLPLDVQEYTGRVDGVKSVKVDVTFEPAWTMEMLSEEAQLELGFL